MEHLQASRSAPDLAALLHARLDDRTRDESSHDDNEDPIHAEPDAKWKRRASQLPTPDASRSTSPGDEDGDGTYSLRIRSESPDMFRRAERRDEREGSTFTDDGSVILDGSAQLQNGHMTPLNGDQPHSDSDSPHHVEGGISPSVSPQISPNQSGRRSSLPGRFLPASLWDYLQEEIRASELDGSQELKAERVTNFFSVPMAVEKVMPPSISAFSL